MQVDKTITIPRYRFREPRFNLPTQTLGRACAEDRFALAFARAYLSQFKAIHSSSPHQDLTLVREIPVNGFGITDLLAVAWTRVGTESFPSAEAFARVAKPTCRAFELKLTDWRKALLQASRYRSFAHQAIVVVPPAIATLANGYLRTFKMIHVGLWSFDPASEQISVYHTPRRHNPRSKKYWFQSLDKAATAAKGSLPIP